MLTKKNFPVLFCVIFLTGGLINSAEMPASPGFSPFKDASSLYTIQYPSHWIVNETKDTVSFTGPSQEGPPTLTIEVRENPQGISLPDYASEFKESYKLRIPEIAFTAETEAWIGKREATKFQMSYMLAGKKYDQETFILPVSRNYMEVSTRVPEQMVTQVKATFNKMIDSLSFLVPLPMEGMEEESPETSSVDMFAPEAGEIPSSGRDPFVDPTQKVLPSEQYSEGLRPPGIEGMIFTEVDFVGIYSGKDGYVAVFNGTDNVGYFLKVGDKLWDGEITKITDNAVYFKQKLADQYSKKQYREVIKYLYPVEEGQ